MVCSGSCRTEPCSKYFQEPFNTIAQQNRNSQIQKASNPLATPVQKNPVTKQLIPQSPNIATGSLSPLPLARKPRKQLLTPKSFPRNCLILVAVGGQRGVDSLGDLPQLQQALHGSSTCASSDSPPMGFLSGHKTKDSEKGLPARCCRGCVRSGQSGKILIRLPGLDDAFRRLR